MVRLSHRRKRGGGRGERERDWRYGRDRSPAAYAERPLVNTLHSPALSTVKSFYLEGENDVISPSALTPTFPPCLARFTDSLRRMGSLETVLPLAGHRTILPLMVFLSLQGMAVRSS